MRDLPSKPLIVAFDLDGTLTNESGLPDYPNTTMEQQQNHYKKMTPNQRMIDKCNDFYDNKAFVKIFTSRSDYHTGTTFKWLKDNGVKYDLVVFNKTYYDVFYDDKNKLVECDICPECGSKECLKERKE